MPSSTRAHPTAGSCLPSLLSASCPPLETSLEKPSVLSLENGMETTVSGKRLSIPPPRLWWVLSFLRSRSSIASLQVKEDNWETVVAILLALMDHLPSDICSLAAANFLPALKEGCCLCLRVTECC